MLNSESGEEKMKRIAFIILLLVLWLATFKEGASPKAPPPDSARPSYVAIETTVLSTPGQNLVP